MRVAIAEESLRTYEPAGGKVDRIRSTVPLSKRGKSRCGEAARVGN